MKTFNLTDPGEGLTEAEVVRWLVAVGEEVKINDIVVEVETSKSLVELPIPWAGRVDALLVEAGATVAVGTPLIRIDDGSGPGAGGLPEAGAAGPAAAEPGAVARKREPNLVGYGPTEGATRRRARRTPEVDEGAAKVHDQVEESVDGPHPVSRPVGEPAPLHAVHAQPSGESLPRPGRPAPQQHPAVVATNKVLAKPPLRKYAKEHGVDLSQVPGTGPGGVIRRSDVEAYLEARAAAATPAQPGADAPAPQGSNHRHPGLEDRREPIKGVRKATAAAMVSSAFTAPHASEWVTVDVSESMELLERIRRRREFRDVKVSPLLLVAKAVSLALRRTPEMNTSWDEEAQEIVYHGQVNLGIAAATPRGLLVPNIPDAGAMELLELAYALNEVSERAKQGRTQPGELAGGTFTITNVGPFGIDSGTPILNPGEAGILALGQITRRPWVVGEGADEQIVPRWVTTLAVSFDHRLMDGEGCSLFLADVARILRDPGQALLF